jgi:hypothetical protein
MSSYSRNVPAVSSRRPRPSLSELSPSRIQEAIATLREQGRSMATCNHTRNAIQGFSRWALKDGRTRDDSLIGVTGYNAWEDGDMIGGTARVPLPPDVADDLAPWVRGSPPKECIFQLPRRGEMLRIDLQAAGITFRDGSGLVFEFHSLLCQCATLADMSGASPRVAQKMMRVSTLDLVSRYARPRVLDIEVATSALSPLRPSESAPAAVLATTTD